LENGARGGDSPVSKNNLYSFAILKYFKKRQLWRKSAELSAKAKYIWWSIVNKYREGKVKSRPVRPMK